MAIEEVIRDLLIPSCAFCWCLLRNCVPLLQQLGLFTSHMWFMRQKVIFCRSFSVSDIQRQVSNPMIPETTANYAVDNLHQWDLAIRPLVCNEHTCSTNGIMCIYCTYVLDNSWSQALFCCRLQNGFSVSGRKFSTPVEHMHGELGHPGLDSVIVKHGVYHV